MTLWLYNWMGSSDYVTANRALGVTPAKTWKLHRCIEHCVPEVLEQASWLSHAMLMQMTLFISTFLQLVLNKDTPLSQSA